MPKLIETYIYKHYFVHKTLHEAMLHALLIDEDIMDWDNIGMHPCDNTATLKIAKNDFFKIILEAMHHTYKIVHLIGEDSII